MMDFSIIYSGFALILLGKVDVNQGSNNLKCYDVQCNGIDCLEVAIETRAILPTCTATIDDGCYIEKEQADGDAFTRAGCRKCASNVIHTTGKTPSPGLQTADDGTPELTTETTTLPSEQTTDPFHWYTRKRRAISEKVTEKCCFEDYCNRDNPCGLLTCSAGAPSFTIFLILISVVTCFCYSYF